MKRPTVYILRCQDGSYYTGVTSNLDERLPQHGVSNSDSYTSRHKAVELMWSHETQTMNEAIAIEKQIKGWRREKKEALIAGRTDLLPSLSKAYSSKDNPVGSE